MTVCRVSANSTGTSVYDIFRPWRKDAGNEAWNEGGRGPRFLVTTQTDLVSTPSTGLSGHSEWTLDPTSKYGRTSEWTETANSKLTGLRHLQFLFSRSWRKMPESDAQSVTKRAVH